MSGKDSKIITTLEDRLRIDATLRDLARTDNRFQLEENARHIVDHYGREVIAPLLALLDTANAQLRGGLGEVATLLDPADIVPALRQIAYDRQQGDQARLAAITILERFLDVEPDAAMYTGMADPEAIALRSLHEVLEEAEGNPFILLEYLEQLGMEPADVLMTMVRSTAKLGGVKGVPILRMFVQDSYLPASQEALDILGNIADTDAANALQSLIPTLPPALQARGRRLLQKLRLRGVPVNKQLPPSPDLRCLASPIDSSGTQLLWFLAPAMKQDSSQVLQILIGAAGVIGASGHDALANSELPEAIPAGSIPSLAVPGLRPQLILLEVPFDYGRRRVLAGLDRNWQNRSATPLAYRLLNPLLWQWAEPQPAPTLVNPQSADWNAMADLLKHPAMSVWFLELPEMVVSARRFLTGQTPVDASRVRQTAHSLLRRALLRDESLLPGLRQNLLLMQEWLYLAGDQRAADLAHMAAATLDEQPDQHPLLLRLSDLGLRMAMINLTRGAEASSPSQHPG